MDVEKGHFIEKVDIDNIPHSEETLDRDLSKLVLGDDILKIRYYNKNVYYGKLMEPSRITPYYYNGTRVDEGSVLIGNREFEIPDGLLTIKEKIASDKMELLFRKKFEKLKSYEGEYIRVHFIENGRYNSIVVRLKDVIYFNHLVGLKDNKEYTISFIDPRLYITRINTSFENIYENEFISSDEDYENNLIQSYGYNLYNKRMVRRRK
jgi:hypothetical protein